MSNAANNIEAKSKSLRELLKERRYKVGYFQREYKWGKSNIEDLINDLERSFFSNYSPEHVQKDVAKYDCYYMGPIVLYMEDSEFSIVDGQQRLTSFTLLMIYINHLSREILEKEGVLSEYIFSDYYGEDAYNLNVPDRVYLMDKLFKGIEVNEKDLGSESCENLYDRYGDIADYLPLRLRHREVLPLFISWLTEKLIFVEILAQTSQSAYTIFETMNDRGLNLTSTEMLKSYLLSNVKDETKIKELDLVWKNKISFLKTYSQDEDQDFFKAWLRGKYANTIRSTDKDSENEDFEKIGTRFHNWVQDNKRLIKLDKQDDFYFLVQSDFEFFSSIYVKLLDYELDEGADEHTLKLVSYKGVSSSLSYPLIISSIQKIDDDDIVSQKIDMAAQYLDCFGIYRLLLNDPITHSSIRNFMYSKIRQIRDNDLDSLYDRLTPEITTYQKRFAEEIDHLPFDKSNAKYILARLSKHSEPNVLFEEFYFQRKRNSYTLYQFFTPYDAGSEVNRIPNALKEIFFNSLYTYCIVPKSLVGELEDMSLAKRIDYLIENNHFSENYNYSKSDSQNLKDFFLLRNRQMKLTILSIWNMQK